MTKGILMAAWGKRGYIYAAYNLAFSIKHFNRMLPVTLYCDENILAQITQDQREIFDNIIFIDRELIGQEPAKIKMSCYDILPYDHTLFLDVDALALQDLEPCIDDMIKQGGYFYSHILNLHNISQGKDIPQMVWANADVIWKKYNLPEDAILPATNSSFQFIKKGKESDKLIAQVKANFADPIPLHELKSQWGASQPDELYLNIALAQVGWTGKPDKEYMFMGFELSPKPFHVIQKELYILSIFGGHRFTKPRYTEWYDRLLIKMFYAEGKRAWYKYANIARDKHANTRPIKFTLELRAKLGMATPVVLGKSPEDLIIYTAWYKCKTAVRQKELDKCLRLNLENPEVKNVVIVTDDECTIEHPKLTIVKTESRPTYDDFIRVVNERTAEREISMITNADIWIDQSNAQKIKGIDFTGRALCLSRWNEDVNGRHAHFNYEYSQDSWVFKGRIENVSCDSFLGIMQCDGRFAYEVSKSYKAINPSKDIQTFHIHKTGERNYDVHGVQQGEKRPVQPEYMGAYAKKRLLINQPGQTGDILICAPIALYYSDKYFVEWYCPLEFHALFEHLPYVTPVAELKEKNYNKVVDMSFGLGGKPERWWQQNKTKFSSFVEAKYELAGLPVQYKNLLTWSRDEKREKELFEKVVGKAKKYALVHDSSRYGTPPEINTELPVIKFEPIEGYTIFDWLKVIQKATEIHCIDSSLCNFVDMIEQVKAALFYYKTDRVPNQWDETLLNKNWTRITNEVSITN